jgi:hypothetical protein
VVFADGPRTDDRGTGIDSLKPALEVRKRREAIPTFDG